MADSKRKISILRFLCIFIAVILLCDEKKIVSVAAQDDADAVAFADDNCGADLSKFIPAPYGNMSRMTCATLWSTFILRYFQSKEHVMTIVLSATYTTGWVGMGFSNSGMMAGSSAMVGWIGEESQPSIKQFFLNEPNPSEVIPDSGHLNLSNIPPIVVLHGSTIYLAFQLNFASQLKNQSILLAYAARPPANNQLQEHDERTSILYDFSAGSVSKKLDSLDKIPQSHRAVSILGWGILLPAGAIIARYYRHHDPLWYYLHTSIQFVGFCLAISAVWTGNHINHQLQVEVGSHKSIGYIALVLCILQVISIAARPSLHSKFRMYWNWYHFLVGRSALFLGSLNIVIGLQIGGTGAFWKIGYGILLAVILVTVIMLEALLILRRVHEQTLPPPTFQVKPFQ